MLSVSLEDAKKIILVSQGLCPGSLGFSKHGVLNAIEHLGYIQLDTLSVVERAHHHVLWTRLPDYAPSFLDQLLENDKRIFEYWSHAASFLPMKDFRFSLPRKHQYLKGKSHWFERDKKMMNYVLDRIKQEGPLLAKDFETPRRNGVWYEWKPAKKALEQLFMEGTLMVAKRSGFQKVYDLTERVLPNDTDTSYPSDKEYIEHLICSAIDAHGIVAPQEISYLRKGIKEKVNAGLNSLVKSGELQKLKVERLGDTVFYSRKSVLEGLEKDFPENEVYILSPFDNLIIQRKRIERIFNFSYQMECYVPEPKRIYGYFSLPVIYGKNFVARMDCKADRKEKVFYIRNFVSEPVFTDFSAFLPDFSHKVKAFAVFNGCTDVVVEKAIPSAILKDMKRFF